jgi:hypothetical protein
MGTKPENDSDIPQFARGVGGPFGKFDYAEVKTHLDEATHTGWLQLCNRKDVKSSELLRDIVYLLVHNKTPAEFIADDRRGLLNLEGPNGVRSRLGADT